MTQRTHTLNPIRRCYLWAGFVLLLVTSVTSAWAQVCFNGPDLDAPTRTAIEGAARKYLDMSVHGDVAGLKANAIPAIAGDFSSIEQAVVTNKDFLAGGQASITGNLSARRLAGQGHSAARGFLLRHLQLGRPHRLLHSQPAAGPLRDGLPED